MKVLYYVSGHGYGHISRSYEVIKYLLSRNDITNVTVSSARIDFIKDSHPKLKTRRILMDVGVFQKDSISLDVDKTRMALEEFESQKNDLLNGEIAYAKKEDFHLIISDSASLPLVMGVELKIPALFLGNFTWDFIYRNFASHHPYFRVIANTIQIEYSFATSAIQLPFTCPMEGFLETHPIGLIGRHSHLTKKEARKKYGFRDGEKYFLFSFGAYGLEGMTWNWNEKPSNWHIIINNMPSLTSPNFINIETDHYPDLVNACDYVVTKPGYGIVSEAILSNTPIIYTDRGDFAEYPYLVEGMKKYHLSGYLSKEDLFRFQFHNSMEEIKDQESNPNRKNLSDGIKDLPMIIDMYL